MFGLIFGIIILLVGVIGFGVLRANDEWKVFAWPALTVSLIGCVVSIFLSCVSNVGTGKTGVVTTFGKIEEYTLDSGFHFVAPWNKVTEIDTTINEITVDTPAYTKDSQTVNLQLTLQYKISTVDTFAVVRDNGIKDTQSRIESKIENRIMSVSKSIVSSKKADDLLTNRSELVTEIATSINNFSDEYYIIVSAVNLTNIDFTDEYEAAVAAKVAQQQAYEKALIEQQQALAQAENEKNIKLKQAEAEAETVKIQAEADLAVQKINADAAEYTGKKEAAVVLNRLAGINGWNVVLDDVTGLYRLYNTDGTEVTETQRQEGVKRLIEYYYTQTWNGELPDTLVTEDSISGIILGA